MEYLKVSSKSSPSSVAGAIAGMIKDGVPVEIDPAYALDAADIKSSGIALGAE